MRHATFRQLEIFEAVARNLSFTRASEELYLTQPTVSMQVRKLADSVGLPLLEQIGKRVCLTQAGEEMLRACREVFDVLDRYDQTLADLRGLRQGRLRLAVVTTAKYFAPRLLGDFCKQYPGIEVSLKVTNRERCFQRFQDNLDDLYILGQPPEDLDAEAEPFLDNPLVVLAPHDHPLAGQTGIPLNRLAEEPFLVREAGSGTRMALQRLLDEHGLQIRVRMELGSNEAIKQSVVAGLGVSVLSQHALALDGAMGQLTVLDVAGFPIVRQWYVAYPKGKQLSVIARAFKDFLHSSSARHVQLDCAHAVAGHCPFLTQTGTGSMVKASDAA